MINSFDYRGYIVTGFPVFWNLYKTLFELLQNEVELRNHIKNKTIIQIDDSLKIKIKKFGTNVIEAIEPNFHFLVYSKRLKEKIKNYFKPNKHTNFYSYVNIEFVSNNAKVPIHIADADKIVN